MLTKDIKRQTKPLNQDLSEINILEIKMERRIKREYRINMIATVVFIFFALLVSMSYVGMLLESAIYQLLRDFLIMVVSLFIYGMGGWYFYKATLIFKQAADDFGM